MRSKRNIDAIKESITESIILKQKVTEQLSDIILEISENISYVLAKKIGVKTIGFTGSDPNLMGKVSDICLCVPSSTPRIQEAHIMIWHIISDLVEKNL